MRLVVTAGYDKSRAAIITAELLRRSQHEIAGVFVVNPYSIKRLRSKLRQVGIEGIKKLISQQFGSGSASAGIDAVSDLAAEHQVTERSLKTWCSLNNVRYLIVPTLNGETAAQQLRSMSIDAVMYCGGGILRSSFIRAAGGAIVNQHCGPLPAIRGMNAIEWAILLGHKPEITVHMIDEGIDTGEILARRSVQIDSSDSVEEIRSKAVATGITCATELMTRIRQVSELEHIENDWQATGRQCFVMTPAIRELLELQLSKRD